MSGTVDFAVLLSSYRNPSSTTASNSVCDNTCNNTFSFCLQDLSGNCGLGTVNSSSIQDDDFSFGHVLSSLNISNPLYFEDITPRVRTCWPFVYSYMYISSRPLVHAYRSISLSAGDVRTGY